MDSGKENGTNYSSCYRILDWKLGYSIWEPGRESGDL